MLFVRNFFNIFHGIQSTILCRNVTKHQKYFLNSFSSYHRWFCPCHQQRRTIILLFIPPSMCDCCFEVSTFFIQHFLKSFRKQLMKSVIMRRRRIDRNRLRTGYRIIGEMVGMTQITINYKKKMCQHYLGVSDFNT